MAGELFKKLEEQVEEQLNCSICLDTYTDPKQLQCFHVYCQKCLVPLVVRDQQGKLKLACPTCRQVTPIPDRGVAGLQSVAPFQINRLLEIQDSVKKLKNPVTTPERGNRSRNAGYHCIEHVREELKLYCETCGVLICLHCGIKGGKHHDHNCLPLEKAFEQYKKEIVSFVEPLEKQVTTVKKALAQLDRHREEISDQQAIVEYDVHVTFRRLREVLNARETEIISQLHQTIQGIVKKLAAQSDRLKATLEQLNTCLHFIGESLASDSERDVLILKAKTMTKAKRLVSPFQPDFMKPDTIADLTFSASADLIASCQNYGQILAAGPPNPSKCHVIGRGAEVAAVGKKSTAILHALNSTGIEHDSKKLIESLECEIVSEITGTSARCGVERKGGSQYEISYQPNIKGRHQLHVRVGGQHVRGSPFSVAVKSPVVKLGTPLLAITDINEPVGVATGQKGEVIVAEGNGHCVSVFSPRGEKIRSFGMRGSNKGQFNYPHSIAVDAEGNILVADCINFRIQKFSSEGQFLTAVSAKRNGPQQFSYPIDIAFNASTDKVYVLSAADHCVQVLNSDLTFSSTFGKKGSDKGQFNSPCGIACDSTGKVYVADTSNHRIQVFTHEGTFLRMFGKSSQVKGEFFLPSGIAIDTSGLVYVSDCGSNHVSLFTSDGQFVLSFGRKGSGPGEFNRPYRLAVDNTGVVYVCDRNNHRVQVF